jgi:DNA-binding protein HU-beta
MKKNVLIDAVAESSGYTKQAIREVLDATQDVLHSEIVLGNPVSVLGLGKFSVSDRPAKKARNLHTGETVIVPARRAALFRPSATIRNALNA